MKCALCPKEHVSQLFKELEKSWNSAKEVQDDKRRGFKGIQSGGIIRAFVRDDVPECR